MLRHIYQLHQPGFRRNALGQLFRDQDGGVIVYVTVKQPPQFGGDNVTGNMYGKSVFLTSRYRHPPRQRGVPDKSFADTARLTDKPPTTEATTG